MSINAMDASRDQYSLRFRVSIAILCCFFAASTFVLLCDARSHGRIFQNPKLNQRISSFNRPWKNLKSLNHFFDSSDTPLMGFSGSDSSYGSPSSLSLPPLNSQAPEPTPSTSSSPYPPFTPPSLPDYSSPISNPPHYYPPSSPGTTVSPITSPPPKHGQSPPKSVPSPPLGYMPPLVYPPPPSAAKASSPPPHKKPQNGHWCVAKPTVPDQIIQQAMDYACGSGADCKGIQPNGPCYQPNTLLAHASYAFNSYWQNMKARGGTCDFGGTAMLVTVDPSFEKCHFMLT